MSAVEWRSIGSLLTRKRLKAKNINEHIPVYAVTNNKGFVLSSEMHEFTIHSEDTSNYSVVEHNDFAYNPSRLNIGSISYFKSNDKGLISPMYVVFHADEKLIIPEYLYIVIKSEAVKNKIEALKEVGARFRFDFSRWELINIPIPSIAIQQEIVSHLYTFSILISSLESELEMRRKQYEHYRNQLLDFEGVEMNLQDFCILKAGKSIKAEEIATEKDLQNRHPCYGGNGIRGYVPYKSHEGEYPIIGRQGALCGCVNWATGEFYATEHAIVVKGKENVEQRFLFILFQNADLNQYKTQGAQPGLSVAKLNELYFSIPPLETQQKIVEKLDAFEQLIQSLETEIKLRKQQYEYYREKLLTFEKEE